ncbi:MAG TPA: hypothetical protein VKB93_28730 [Thermoanaerobaculia bacterium]|nr:hypothetical protein [Thermoanaerobaculia bacterium]
MRKILFVTFALAANVLRAQQAADVAVTATLMPAEPAAGERVQVEIRARNNGPTFANVAQVSFGSVLEPMVVLSASATAGYVCTQTPRIGGAACSGSLGPGAEVVMTATVVAPNRIDRPWEPVASVFRGDEPDDNPLNNFVNFHVTLRDAPHADLTTSLSGPALVEAGTTVKLTYVVTNDGPAPTGPVYAGFFVLGTAAIGGFPSTGSGWQCNTVSGTSTLCTRSTLASGQTSVLEVTIPAPQVAADMTAVARTFAEGIADPDPADNVAAHELDVVNTLTFEPILIPITRTATPGAFNSQWKSETTMYVNSDGPLDIQPRTCTAASCFPFLLPFNPYLFGVLREPPPQFEGQFVYVPQGSAEDLRVHTRVYDEAQRDKSFGVEVPAVRPDDFTPANRSTVLLDVPIGSQFRHTLRIYDRDPTPGRRVVIFVRLMGERTIRAEISRVFDIPPDNNTGPFGLPLRPGYIQFSSNDLPSLSGVDRIWYSIAPTDFTTRLWAFASITNNTTQEVTIVTP